MTSTFLFARSSLPPFAPFWACLLGLAGAFFALSLADTKSLACGATLGNGRWTAAQIRATAAFRSVNFFTGFSSVNGATPAKLFQTSTSRDAGHSAASLASSFSEANDCRFR